MSGRTVIAGLGNEYRSDDGAGLLAARRVAALLGGVEDIGPIGEPLELLGRWDGAGIAIVLDTVRSGGTPGRVHTSTLEPAEDAELVEHTTTSTHGIGLSVAIRLARALGTLPGRVVLVGIEGSNFAQGEGITPSVRAGVDRAVDIVLASLGSRPNV